MGKHRKTGNQAGTSGNSGGFPETPAHDRNANTAQKMLGFDAYDAELKQHGEAVDASDPSSVGRAGRALFRKNKGMNR